MDRTITIETRTASRTANTASPTYSDLIVPVLFANDATKDGCGSSVKTIRSETIFESP